MKGASGGHLRAHSWAARCSLCLLLALLSACALQAVPRERQAPVAPGVLAYYDWLENASRVDALVEAARLLAPPEDGTRLEWELRLALLWSVSVLASEDSARAARCLLDVSSVAAPTPHAGDYPVFARIWRAQLLLRDNLRAADAALSQAEDARREAEQSRQLLRRELDEVLADSAGQGERIRALEARIDTLSRQIEALTSIEQQLVEREQEQTQGE